MTERRFTDRDVALILRRAAELDKDSGHDSAARGLSLRELQDIASEAGINPDMIARAASELGGRQSLKPASLLGAAVVNRQTRAVPRELTRKTLGELVRIVDQRVPAQGTAVEALGSVRWSAPGRLVSRQVSLEPSRGETLIRVEERYAHRVRGMLHGIPAAYGALFGWVIGLESIGGVAPGLILGAALAAGAWGLGGVIWNAISRRSRGRVEILAEELAHEATRRAVEGEVPEPDSNKKTDN
jgi:hypothetical protein